MRRLPRWIALCAVATPLTAAAADLDSLFKAYGPETPGCAVGVARDGQPPVLRAYGSADLEHHVPNTPDTVFEAASISMTSTEFPAAISRQLEHSLQLRNHWPSHFAFGQRIAFAKMRAIEVFPIPREPVRR